MAQKSKNYLDSKDKGINTNECDIGSRIRILREAKGMTQEEFAAIVGYKSQSTIAKIESGERDLYLSTIVAIAKALDVSPIFLIGWDNEDEN